MKTNHCSLETHRSPTCNLLDDILLLNQSQEGLSKDKDTLIVEAVIQPSLYVMELQMFQIKYLLKAQRNLKLSKMIILPQGR